MLRCPPLCIIQNKQKLVSTWLTTACCNKSIDGFVLSPDVAFGGRGSSPPHPAERRRARFLCFPHLFTYLPHPSVYTLQLLTVTFSLRHVSPLLCRRVCPAVVARASNRLPPSLCRRQLSRKFGHGRFRVTLFRVIKSDEYFIGRCVFLVARTWPAKMSRCPSVSETMRPRTC